jgi:hypothetical protein
MNRAVWVMSPLLYGLATLGAAMLAVGLGAALTPLDLADMLWGSRSTPTGPMALSAAAATAVIVLMFATRALTAFEQITRPRWLDHIRQCALLYLAVLVLGFRLLMGRLGQPEIDASLLAPLAIVVAAILTNAAALWWLMDRENA